MCRQPLIKTNVLFCRVSSFVFALLKNCFSFPLLVLFLSSVLKRKFLVENSLCWKSWCSWKNIQEQPTRKNNTNCEITGDFSFSLFVLSTRILSFYIYILMIIYIYS